MSALQSREMQDATTIRELMMLVRLAIDMRRLQRIYFRTASDNPYKRDAMNEAREAERKFDRSVAAFKMPSLL